MISIVSYLILPLLLSGVVHHFFVIKYDIFKSLKLPVDLGVTFFGQRVFGDSKTLRGFMVVIILTGLFMYILSFVYPSFQLKVNPFLAGTLLGFGYSLGELPTSFLKRRFDVPTTGQETGLKGFVFYTLEQIDSVIGALIIAQFLLTLDIRTTTSLFVTGVLLHSILDLVLYFRGYKQGLSKPFYLK
ncbi:MAG: CDP-archaeol synthase [Candidatus Woykebacteria bacterium]